MPSNTIVNVLSTTRADSIHFTKINEFGDMTDLTFDDMLFITAVRDGEEVTKNVRVRDFGKFFDTFNVEAQWFIPVVNGSKISWQWSDAVASIDTIDIAAMIPVVSDTANGLMTSIDKLKLDNMSEYKLPIATEETLGGVKPDGQSIVVDENGVMSAVTGMPVCTQCTLKADSWDPDSKSQKISMAVNVDNRNVVDYPPQYIQIVSQHHVLAINEESDGITFQCDSIPVNDITVYITSMGVINHVN